MTSPYIGDFLILLFVFVLLACVVGFYFNRYRQSNVLSFAEIGRKQIYSERCGVQIGLFYISWPFGRVSVYEDLLIVSAYEQVELFSADIWNLKSISRFGYNGIQVLHIRKELPNPVIIWTWHPTNLREIIEVGLHLPEMPTYGKNPAIGYLPAREIKERERYPWLR